jgi:hypothetical protein
MGRSDVSMDQLNLAGKTPLFCWLDFNFINVIEKRICYHIR